MTISTTINRVQYTGNGVTTAFPFPYYFLANADLVVVETIIATGVQTVKTITTHYTVTGAADPSGGTVTAVSAPASTVTWTIYRDPALTQAVDLVENDPLPVETAIEQPLDRLTMIEQRTRSMITRSLRQPEGDTADIDFLPAKVTRASKLLGFDADGDPIASEGTGGATTSVFMATVLDDLTAAAARTTLGLDDGSAILHVNRLSINRSAASPVDPVGYETPLLVVSNNNEDNVVTLRAQDSNVNGHTAIRLQDYAGAERGAVGLGGDHVGNPFRYTVFMEGGNISGNYGTRDTHIMLGMSHLGDPNIADGFVPRIAISCARYDGATDAGGWTRIGSEDRGVAKNAIIISRAGMVGIGLNITQSSSPTGSDPSVVSTLQVNGSALFDMDNCLAMANSAELVVVRNGATAKASIRVGVDGVGALAVGFATRGAIGVDTGDISFKTGITTADLSTGTERFRITSGGNVGVGTATFGTNAAAVLSIANGTAPTTGPADTVQFYSSDNSAGHTIPSFFCEGTEVLATGQADSVSSVRVKMRINGTAVTLLAI